MINALLAWMTQRIQDDATMDGILARSVIEPAKGAVYSTIPVPPGARLPYVYIGLGDGMDPSATFDAEYRRPVVDVHVYDARPDAGGGSVARVNAAAERLRQLFNAFNFEADVAGVRVLVMRCSEVIENDGDSAFGRVIETRCLLAASAQEV